MKKEWILPFACVLFPIILAIPTGCTSDVLPEPSLDFCDSLGFNSLTFDAEINTIVETKCMDLGCHTSAFIPGDFTSDQGMVPFLSNGKVNTEVFIDGTMPPPGSPELTQEEKDMLQCWIGNDYPEN